MNEESVPLVGRRKALALGAGALAAGAMLGTTGTASAATWTLRWSPTVSGDGLRAFEGLEDDRAGSHPGVKHIYTEGDHWRFDMHTRDVDTSTDRQRNESKGMRKGDTTYKILQNQTWRITYQAYWPTALTATTAFTHLFQMKVSDVAAPQWTLTPRQKGGKGVLTIAGDAGASADLTDYAPLQNKWIDVFWEFKASHNGYLHCVLKDGSKTVADVRKSADLWRDKNYLRPKWGVYRSLNSSGLKNCHQNIRGLKSYQLV